MTEERFNLVIHQACQIYSMSETSGHRTTKRNASVGGANDSQHLGWRCKDLVPDDLSRLGEIKTFLESQGLYVEPLAQAKDHIHVDDRYDHD